MLPQPGFAHVAIVVAVEDHIRIRPRKDTGVCVDQATLRRSDHLLLLLIAARDAEVACGRRIDRSRNAARGLSGGGTRDL